MREADLCWMLLPRLSVDLHWGRLQKLDLHLSIFCCCQIQIINIVSALLTITLLCLYTVSHLCGLSDTMWLTQPDLEISNKVSPTDRGETILFVIWLILPSQLTVTDLSFSFVSKHISHVLLSAAQSNILL